MLRVDVVVRAARHPQGFEAIKERGRARGLNVGKVTQEGILDALDRTEIPFTSAWNVKQVLLLAETLFPMLMERQWSVVVPANGAGDFICSDMPGVLHDATPVPPGWGPSFVARRSEFTMPLNREVLLSGRFDMPSDKGVADARNVAILNGRAIRYAKRLCCPHEDFTWQKQDLSIGNRAELLAALAEPDEDPDEEETEE